MNDINLTELYLQRDKNLSDDPNTLCKDRIFKLIKYSKGDERTANIVKTYWNACNDWETLEKFYNELTHEEMILLGY